MCNHITGEKEKMVTRKTINTISGKIHVHKYSGKKILEVDDSLNTCNDTVGHVLLFPASHRIAGRRMAMLDASKRLLGRSLTLFSGTSKSLRSEIVIDDTAYAMIGIVPEDHHDHILSEMGTVFA